ncbi:MAG: carboxypeptidase-like regulatory domain-containing protein, partial [Vicinamibacterales bacterium]
MDRQSCCAVVVVMVLGMGVGCGSSAMPTSPSGTATASPPQPTQMQLTGFVADSAFRPLAGARVEVVDGPSSGVSAIADASGQFSLTGLFNSATSFRASQRGHVSATQPWSCSVSACPGSTGARPWLGFYLTPDAPAVNIAGDYTLTFVADSTCADLPAELRTRSYAATIAPAARRNTPAETSFALTVSGATFLRTFDSFDIGVAGDYVGFFLDGGHDPPVVEQVANNSYLAF